ncbi:MAG TPA: tetratricopeptide repeat protein [Bryobacteraceae bacterium]|nr:tetratricopeptide repeat protein [Bryobacteraceae bacterium]
MTLHAYEQYEAAARAYSRAHLLDPRAFDWVYLGAVILMQQGDFDGAVKSLQTALQLRPGDLAAELRLGQSLIATGNWDDADILYRRILDKHPDFAQAWYGLGRVQAAKGEHAAAAQSYGKACEVFPAYGAAHFALAGELRRLGQRAEAEEHAAAYAKDPSAEPPLRDALLQRTRELNQGVQIHLQRGRAFEKEGKLEEAIREHEAALAIEPGNVQAHINLISLYGRTGDAARAKEHFEVAGRLSPGRPDAWYNYGVLMFQQKAYGEAEEAFRRAVEINPYHAEAHNNLGAIYALQSRLNDAAREFRTAIANRPDYPLARFHLARILVNEKNYDEAIQHLLRALTPEDDQTPLYTYALAAAYARAGKREHALRYYGRARDAAIARGQSQLLSSIDRDLKMFAGER